ncbi:RNA 2'-phosphotransferase [Spirillospora albida]|uniref:RNA 2'-phosphotransferase n=1 Tax=Spirillospora albida TaxID=58123 RepID=UPI0004C149C8|nr:RNA 2'-phosphotransferase [Spirillospora albida]
MDQRRVVKISKYLSRHLRHDPGRIGLTLDEAGWVLVDVLLAAMARNGFAVTRAELEHVVAVNDKKRFALDGDRIRAVQGHSIPVVLDHPVADPPEFLYHGTVSASLEAIRRDGLHPMNRHAVHLSPDRETAHRVGSRRGRPVILTVAAARMAADGHEFQLSPNGVWLTATVPPQYLD